MKKVHDELKKDPMMLAIKKDGFKGMVNEMKELYAILNDGFEAGPDIFSLSPHNSIGHHMVTALVWLLIECVIMTVFYLLHMAFQPFWFTQVKEFPRKLEIVQLVCCNIHHVVIFYFGIQSLFTRCDKPLDYLRMNEKCFRTYRPIYSQCLAITFGKFSFDFLL